MTYLSKISSLWRCMTPTQLAVAVAAASLSIVIGVTAASLVAELISVGTDGQAGQGDTYYVGSEIRAGAVSDDGRYVVFSSLAGNLTSHDVSGWHVYLRDRQLGRTTLVSDTGEQTVYGSTMEGAAVISADGRFVAFQSTNSLLVPGDANGSADIFVFDTDDSSIERVSVASDGSESCPCSCSWPDTCNGCEYAWLNAHPSISADGRYVAFTSYSYNLVAGDLPDTPDVFVHDRHDRTTTIISHASDGNLGNAASGEPVISADGDAIAFASRADNLVVEDWNGRQDVFLWRRDAGELTRISVATDGTEGNSDSTNPVISEDGRLIAFTSGATTLAVPDSNGFIYDIFLHDVVSGSTSILSAGLQSGGNRPAISGNGEYVSFTSGSDIYRVDATGNDRQLIDDYMQFSALNHDGLAVVLSGYASLVPEDTNGDKDVYLITALDQEPPTTAEVCDDGLDNDGDGLIDCLDKKDCRQHLACKTTGGGGNPGGGGGGGGGKNR